MPRRLTALLASPLAPLLSWFQTADTSRGFAQQSGVSLVGHWMQTEWTGPEAPGQCSGGAVLGKDASVGGCLRQTSRCLEVGPLIPVLSCGLSFFFQFVF